MSANQSATGKNLFSDFIEMTKPGLVLFVMITVALSYWMATEGRPDWFVLLELVFGTYLTASAAHIFNQLMEVQNDGRMTRTRNRPLCSGRIKPRDAFLAGFVLAAGGLAFLWFFVNPLTFYLCLLTLVLYLLAYTPLKKITVWNTWVGALPGALPAFMGWSAAWNALPLESWTLFLIVFFWQIPHFLALAWSYREDYRKGGYKMLTLIDQSGKKTAWHSIIHIFFLLEISLLPYFLDQAGVTYLLIAVGLGLGFAYIGFRFLWNPDAYSKKMFLYSIVYLPVIYLGLSLEDLGFSRLESRIVLFFQA